MTLTRPHVSFESLIISPSRTKRKETEAFVGEPSLARRCPASIISLQLKYCRVVKQQQ